MKANIIPTKNTKLKDIETVTSAQLLSTVFIIFLYEL